jgi:putative peptidoglycan lipid II flippase
VTGPPATATEPGPLRQAGRGIGRAALLIGGITVVARAIGFGRQLVFAHTIGSHCLGTAYATANQVPNIVYDIVLGGALTSAVIPVMAGVAARRAEPAATGPVPVARQRGATGGTSASPASDGSTAGTAGTAGMAGTADAAQADAETSQTASALLTWTVLLLAPVSLILVLVAGPVTSLLLAGSPGCQQGAMQSLSTRMLAVFAPQILLYGLAVVLYGILQAHRRFTAPALAPVVSSLVVMAAYLAFVPLGAGSRQDVATLSLPAELVLSVGTTAGVAALTITALVPALRLRLRLRPVLRFPAGVARRVRGLAAVGVAVVIAQDISLAVVIVLANGHGGGGALVLYNYGWQMFFVPYAVLAVPIATSAFPVLSAREGGAFDQTAASSTRAVMLVSWLGAALLAGAAIPASRLFAPSGPVQARELAIAFAAFAPGLVGYGLAANLSRVLFAHQRSRVAAIALVAGWLLVIVTDLAAVPAVPHRWVVPVLAMGNTVGLTVAGIALLAAVRAARGPAALAGSGRAALAGLAGALAGAAAGTGVSAGLPVAGFFPNAGVAVLACAAAAAAFGAIVLVGDGGELRVLAARARARIAR